MEPVVLILAFGLVGGSLLALLISRGKINVRSAGAGTRLDPPSPSLINMAHIRVAGGGGLGLVAAVIVVAIVDPRIRLMIAFAVICGVLLAAALIRRRSDGPLPSGPDAAGPHSLLGLERTGSPERQAAERTPQPPVTLTSIRAAGA